MTVFDIAEYSTPLVEALSMFILFDVFLEKRACRSNWSFGLGIVVLAGLIILCNHFFLYQFPNNIIMVLLGVMISLAFFSGPIIYAIIASIVENMASLIFEVLVLNIITVVFRLTVGEVVGIPEYRLLGIVVSKTLLLLFCYVIYRYKKNKKYNYVNNYWVLFFALFGTALITVFLLFKLSYEVSNIDYNGITLLCTLGLFVSVFFSIYLYDRQAQQAYDINLQKQAEVHLIEQLKHMEELVAQQDQLRRFRHDINNQLIALSGYLECTIGKNELQHVRSLTEKLNSMNEVIDTGNPALDAIISSKLALSKKKGIDFRYHLQIPEYLPIAAEDICVVFGNALDNAIEACESSESPSMIRLSFIEKNGVYFCKLVNTAKIKPKNNLENRF